MLKSTKKQIIIEALAAHGTHALTLKPNPDRGDFEPGELTNYRTGLITKVPGRRRLGSNGRCQPRTVSRRQLEHMLVQTIIRIHSRLHGRRARSARYDGQRVTGYAILEDLPDNGHLHLILRVPDQYVERFEAIFAKTPYKAEETIWTEVCPGGTSWLRLASQPEVWANYCAKRLGSFNRDEDFDQIKPIT